MRLRIVEIIRVSKALRGTCREREREGEGLGDSEHGQI